MSIWLLRGSKNSTASKLGTFTPSDSTRALVMIWHVRAALSAALSPTAPLPTASPKLAFPSPLAASPLVAPSPPALLLEVPPAVSLSCSNLCKHRTRSAAGVVPSTCSTLMRRNGLPARFPAEKSGYPNSPIVRICCPSEPVCMTATGLKSGSAALLAMLLATVSHLSATNWLVATRLVKPMAERAGSPPSSWICPGSHSDISVVLGEASASQQPASFTASLREVSESSPNINSWDPPPMDCRYASWLAVITSTSYSVRCPASTASPNDIR